MRKMTRKDIRNEYRNIIKVGYCNLYHTCNRLKKVGYNCGVYGWNLDVYEVDYDTCIVTGYRNLVGNIKLNREDIEALENRCEARSKIRMTYDEQCNKVVEDIQTLVRGGTL